MATVRLATVMQHIYRLAALPAEGERTDIQLLEHFARGDREALEILLRRHGPLVWRVCRRVVRATAGYAALYELGLSRPGSRVGLGRPTLRCRSASRRSVISGWFEFWARARS